MADLWFGVKLEEDKLGSRPSVTRAKLCMTNHVMTPPPKSIVQPSLERNPTYMYI